MDVAAHVNYMAHLDAKKHSYYQVKEYDNGCILLEPRKLIKPKRISAKTLKMMDDSIKNFHQCKVSAPIDLSEF